MIKQFTLFLFGMLSSCFILHAQTATPPAIGDGSAGNPYEISDLNNLYWLSINSGEWANHFIQTADIDASGTSTWNGGMGFSPIGNKITKFTGTYNGKGHIINLLYINRPTQDSIGFFGATENSQIDSVGLENVDITGQSEVGALAGYTLSTQINYCHSSGTITSSLYRVGGLAGKNQSTQINYSYSSATVIGGEYNSGGLAGSIENTGGSINACYSTGNVSGQNWVGGLVGIIWSNSLVKNSYSSGNVSVSGDRSGGLAGYQYNSSFIENCYTTSSMNGNTNVGGLVGYTSNASILNSYSIGNVLGNTNIGGLIGYSNSTITGSFWNTETSGQDASAGGTGLTTTDMQTLCTYIDGTFATWDFVLDVNGTDNAWGMNASENGGYPYLVWQAFVHTENCCGFLDAEDPTPDEISLPDATGECSVDISIYTPTASDNCAVSINGTTSDPLIYTEQGTYTITWIYDDGGGNTVFQTQTVIVEDLTSPAVECPLNQEVSADNTNTYTVIGTELDPLSFNDNCEGAVISNNINGTETLNGEVFDPGTTTVTWTVTDVGGNENTCNFDVTVHEYVSVELLNSEHTKVYPNPTSEFITINGIEGMSDFIIDICDITGKTIQAIREKQFKAMDNRIDIRNYKSGIYFVSLKTHGYMNTFKIIKKE